MDKITIAERKLAGVCTVCGRNKQWCRYNYRDYLNAIANCPQVQICFKDDCERRPWTK